MNRILYKSRCRCNEEFSIRSKKRKVSNRSEGKPLQYPKPNEAVSKTFQIRYDKKLSPIAKLILNSFQNKYIYYAIDDILYSFKSNTKERDNLLAFLYKTIFLLIFLIFVFMKFILMKYQRLINFLRVTLQILSSLVI
jgi:hypothetical protein